MTKPIILDTNLWVYLYSKDPLKKSLSVRELVNQQFERIIVTTQILGELFNVLSRKQLVELEEAKQIIENKITIINPFM